MRAEKLVMAAKCWSCGLATSAECARCAGIDGVIATHTDECQSCVRLSKIDVMVTDILNMNGQFSDALFCEGYELFYRLAHDDKAPTWLVLGLVEGAAMRWAMQQSADLGDEFARATLFMRDVMLYPRRTVEGFQERLDNILAMARDAVAFRPGGPMYNEALKSWERPTAHQPKVSP